MQKLIRWFSQKKVLRQGPVHRVIFYYMGEEPTYLDNANVRLFQNGIVEVDHQTEQVTTHIQNVEIVWKMRGPSNKKNAADVLVGSRSLSLVKSDN
ncbi:MAG: hypothetical protein M9962_06405 [Oligoflexia bacterium]|nr:hypothetical protein [Oligoflexia bacterium]